MGLIKLLQQREPYDLSDFHIKIRSNQITVFDNENVYDYTKADDELLSEALTEALLKPTLDALTRPTVASITS